MSTEAAPEAHSDPTFRSYKPEQGANYAQNRRGYHPDLYDAVINYHAAGGGQLGTVVDVGCGPGIATREIAPRFSRAIGLDPSEGMIATAREIGSSDSLVFAVSTAEDLGALLDPPAFAPGSVDLIIAATAAHWFDMSRFWPAAARALRPGGSVALWTATPMRATPDDAATYPSAIADINAAIDLFERRLDPYILRGNRLARDLYRELPLPWDLAEPGDAAALDRASFVRREFGTDAAPDPDARFMMTPNQAVTLDTLEAALGTASVVTRWREAHPDDIGTERDVVRLLRRDIERALHAAGVPEGQELVRGGVAGVLLMVKKGDIKT